MSGPFFMVVWAGNTVAAHSMVGHCPTRLAGNS